MNAERIKLLHIAPHAHGLGGIETLLRRHAAADTRLGFEPWQIGLFEREQARAGEPYSPQHFGWRDTPRGMRRRMRAAMQARAGSIVVAHNGWGLPWFAPDDGSVRRIVVLHAHPSYYGDSLATLQPWIDGALVVSPRAADEMLALMPGFPAERLGGLKLPIECPLAAPRGRQAGGELVIGCAGRLARAQKRWDRLVPFVAELKRLGVRFRVEVIGRGPLEAWLRGQFRDEPAVQFLGFLENPAFTARMQTWDAAVFFSDVEGGPIVLLEAMAAGAVPFYPTIGGSLGDDYAPHIDVRCHYPAGDAAAAARAVRAVFSDPATDVARLRAHARDLAATHFGDAYETAFAAFVHRIAALPRISRPPDGARLSRWSDRLPLGLITRAFPRALWR